MSAGLWRQHEMWDGTYTLDDLLDITEMLQVRNENERRAQDAALTRNKINSGKLTPRR